jgi:UDP-glucose 4-epimerase
MNLIIGGTGFIGTALTRRLVYAGAECTVLSRSAPEKNARLDGVNYIQGNYGDRNCLDKILPQATQVFLLACTSAPGTSNKDPYADINNNLLPFINLLDAIKEQANKKIVFISSGGAIYEENAAIESYRETDPCAPISSYGIVKRACESYLGIYQNLYGLAPLILRVSNAFGPGKTPIGVQGLISTLVYKALHNQEIVIWGDGSIIRDYIHIKQIVDAAVFLSGKPATGIFNVGSGMPLSVNEVIALVEQGLGKKLRVRYEPARLSDIKRSVLDVSKLKSVMPEFCSTDIKKLISDFAKEAQDISSAVTE